MGGEWESREIRILLEEGTLVIGDGYRAKLSELSDSGLPFARAGNIKNGFHFSDADCLPEPDLHKVGEKISRQGDTVFTSKGTVGRFAFVKGDTPQFVYSPQLCYWRSQNSKVIEPRFLFYWLNSREFYAQYIAVSGQTDMAEYVSLNDQRRMNITLPPLPEQRAIAHILGTLDDKIELNRRMNETLEAMARALFKSWFVDFDPVRAKMAGSDTGLPPHIVALFPDRLVPSELGEIPEGWEVKPLDDIAHFRNGLALQKHRPEDDEEWLPVLKIAQLRNGYADGKEKASANIRPEFIVDDGDIVFSWSGSLLVKVWCGGRAALNQHLFKVTSRMYPKWLVLQQVKSHLAEFQAIAAGKATTMGHIKRQHLTDALCAIPDDRLLAAANSLFSDMFEREIVSDIQSRCIATLRDALLPKLISGEIRVRDAESFLERAL